MYEGTPAKTLNLDCHDSIRFRIFQIVKKCKIIWEKFLLSIVLIELQTFVLKLLNFLSCTLPLLNVMTFRRFKTN